MKQAEGARSKSIEDAQCELQRLRREIEQSR
jgi:hypothetical protein